MTMLRRSLVPLLVLCTSTATLHAADNPVDALPEDSGVVIRIANPTKTVQKGVNFVANVRSEFAPFVQLAGAGVGNLISNPSQAGVDRERDLWFAFVPRAGQEPAPVFAVAATDAKTLKDEVVMNATFVEYEEWVLFSPDEATAAKVQARVDGKGTSVGESAPEQVHQMFQTNDVAIFVNLELMKDVYSDEMAQVRKQVQDGMQQLENFAPVVEGVNMKPIFELYGEMFVGLFNVVDDAQSFTCALSISENEIVLDDLLLVAEGSSTDRFLQRNKPSAFAAMPRMPDGQLVYIGLHGDMSGMMEFVLKFWEAMASDQEGYAELAKSMEDLKAINFGEYYATFDLADMENGALRSTVAMNLSPVEKMRTLTREMSGAMNLKIAGVEQETTVEPDAEKIAGMSVDIVRSKQEVAPEIDPLGIQNELMRVLYGEDGMISRVTYTDDAMLQVIGGTSEETATSYERWKADAVKSNEAVDAVRTQLLEESNIIMLFDLPNFAVDIVSLVVEHGQIPLPINEATLQQMEQDPSYIGFSMSTQKSGLRTKTVIPAAQIKGIVDIVLTIQNTMNNRPEF